jgi:4-hydroxythreonine-4-phosphate dehydrogenase
MVSPGPSALSDDTEVCLSLCHFSLRWVNGRTLLGYNRGMKRLAITMGEPGGVGPEVALRAARECRALCTPVLVGDVRVWEAAGELIGVSPRESGFRVLDPRVLDPGEGVSFEKGRPTAGGGRASVQAIRRAVELALTGEVDAVVTAPISKEALRLAGFPWPGHTELLAELTGTATYAMMLVGGPLRVLLVTIHRALRDVPGLITRESVLRSLELARRAAEMLSLAEPRIAVAGLNPHAGEGGLFGDEEISAIAPAVRDARARGIPASGPYPPDTVYHRAAQGEFDLVVSMYHDQGLIPVKLLAFDTGVNVTVGLPFVRTSPDHGTAYDIAWKGEANPSSMLEAVRLALSLKAA